ncbi:MAG: CHASE3 domain-containing protein [Kofleriaceae bacterium]
MSTAQRRASRRPFVWMAIAFLLLGAVAIVTYAMTSTQVKNTRRVEHSHTVIETVGTLAEHIAKARRSERGYLLTGDPAELGPFELEMHRTRDAVHQLRSLTADNPAQQVRLSAVEPLVEAVLAHLTNANAMRHGRSVDADDMVAVIREGDARMSRVNPILRDLLDEERRLLAVRAGVMAAGVARTHTIQIAGTGVSVVLLLLAFIGLRREIQRRAASDVALRRSETATRELNNDLERRVQVRTAELEASNRELEAFSYSVAHDLRAPLRSLSGFSEILLEDYRDQLDADGVDALERVRDNARKMAVLIDALLSLSRITRSAVKPATVDLSAIVHSVATTLRGNEPREQLVLVIADNVTAILAPDLARTLIEKLLENAWKYTSKQATPRIEFGTDQIEGRRAFFVRDNGAGFDMTHAAKLFVPFHRLHTEAEFPGTGIGLSIAKRIVSRCGGEIWADGKVNQGASFYFTVAETSPRTT